MIHTESCLYGGLLSARAPKPSHQVSRPSCLHIHKMALQWKVWWLWTGILLNTTEIGATLQLWFATLIISCNLQHSLKLHLTPYMDAPREGLPPASDQYCHEPLELHLLQIQIDSLSGGFQHFLGPHTEWSWLERCFFSRFYHIFLNPHWQCLPYRKSLPRSLSSTGMAETVNRQIPKDVVSKDSINENNDIPVHFALKICRRRRSDFLKPIRREIHLHH